jgi:hypothetical protein
MLLSWHETIQEFDFDIVHVKGIANIIPGVLSLTKLVQQLTPY